MSDTSFLLPDRASLGDLRTYLGRAARVDDGAVRVVADSGVLAVYTAVLYPIGLLDEVPTVLGLRTFALAEDADIDAVVPIRSFQERLSVLAADQARLADHHADNAAASDPEVETGADEPVRCTLPLEVNTVTWTAISPPRGGWKPLGEMRADTLLRVAHDGIAEVAAALPASAGVAIVRRIRAEVWGRSIPDVDYVPAGAAFAADSLGFVAAGESVQLFEAGAWHRLSTPAGHVIVKQRTWGASL